MKNLPKVTALQDVIRKKALERLNEEYLLSRKNLSEGIFKNLTMLLDGNKSPNYLGNYFPNNIDEILNITDYDKTYKLNTQSILLKRLEVLENEEAQTLISKINDVSDYLNDN